MREKFLQNLRLHLIDLSRRLEQDPSDDVADDVLYRLQQVASHLSRIAGSASGNVIEDVQHSLGEVTSILADPEHNWQPVPTVLCPTRSAGRPRFEISKDQLEYFAEYELTCPDIAEALGVSVSTIKRRPREFNILIRATLMYISDADLDGVVRNIQADFPNAGYRRMQSQRNFRGIKVSQSRVRESMQRTDPDGVAMRWLSITPRATYCVRGKYKTWTPSVDRVHGPGPSKYGPGP